MRTSGSVLTAAALCRRGYYCYLLSLILLSFVSLIFIIIGGKTSGVTEWVRVLLFTRSNSKSRSLSWSDKRANECKSNLDSILKGTRVLVS